MKTFIRLILFIVILIFNNINTYCNNQIYGSYFFPNVSTNEEEYLNFIPYNILSNISIEEKIFISLENVLNNNKSMVNYIPKGLTLLNVNYYKGSVILNFDENIKNYGGAFFEIKFITQILANCFQFSEVEDVTFLTNGLIKDLKEGSPTFYTKEDFQFYNN